MENTIKKVLVGMSGGVDSSVAVALLMEQGYEVGGVTMNLYNNDPSPAAKVAERMGIPHYFVDYEEQFSDDVIDYFAEEYTRGGTPNPCIVCNKKLKFGAMLDYAQELGYDYVATGHYARITQHDGEFLLQRAIDKKKDQTYFLYTLTQNVLAHTLFPLGGYTKEEVRKIALDLGYENAEKKDSQDICFVEDDDYSEFLTTELGIEPVAGDFLDLNGRKLGRHKGLIYYTIGQRKGLGQTFGKPMYVLKKDFSSNTITLGSDDDLFSNEVTLSDINIVSGKMPTGAIEVEAKTRYNQHGSPATFTPDGMLKFQEGQRAVTPGQSSVFYNGDTLIGGGVISLK